METASEHVLARINAALQRIENASKNIAVSQSIDAIGESDKAQVLRAEAAEALAMLDSVIRKAESGDL